MPSKKKVIAVRLQPELYVAFRKVAEAKDRSMGSLLEEVAEEIVRLHRKRCNTSGVTPKGVTPHIDLSEIEEGKNERLSANEALEAEKMAEAEEMMKGI